MSGCAAAVAEMVQLDYVNDARYAEARAHSLLAARKSRRAAAQSLRQKGLAPAEVAGALEAVYAPEDGDDPELEAAAALVDSRYRKKLAIGRRDLVVAALQRRGFAYPVIKEAIRRVEEGE
jgi:regulatory protein